MVIRVLEYAQDVLNFRDQLAKKVPFKIASLHEAGERAVGEPAGGLKSVKSMITLPAVINEIASAGSIH
jgi:hypothetical protein